MFYVRTATEKDLPRVSEILRETWHSTYDHLYGSEIVTQITDEHHTVERLLEQQNRPNSEFLVADNGSIIGGMAYATQSEKTIKLHQLYVHPDYQGGKTGLHLLIEIENSFLDANSMTLEVEENNTIAVEFYKRYGFKAKGVVEDCAGIGVGIPAIIMEKSVVYADEY